MFLNRKKKVLFCSEASFANTGFGTIYYELISRFHKSNKFRVAEFATACFVNDERDKKIKWRFYPNKVKDNDPRNNEFKRYAGAEFGAWRFEKVLLDFEPDIVIDIRDPQFFRHEYTSCLRPYYYWCIGPTVDSSPQPYDWIEMFNNADAVMPYSDFGYDVLKKENKNIKLHNGYGPGVNLKTFQPLNKTNIRQKYGLDPNAKILGFVSRNQMRKRFPELFKAFKKYLDNSGAKNSYLHCHTATPDLQFWNIPKLLIENNLYNNVLFTYYCLDCEKPFIEKWQDFCTECKYCNKLRAIHPRTSFGCSTDEMCEIINLYDAYIQFANCEGLGVGAIEAAACGVPVMAVDYSAMNSVLNNVGGVGINYTLSRDILVDAERAIPDIEDAAQKISLMMETPKELLYKKGMETRTKCEQNYNWDKIASKWIDFVDNIKLFGQQGKWGEKIHRSAYIKQTDGNLDKIREALAQIGREDLIGSYFEQDLYYKVRLYKSELTQSGISQSSLNKILNSLGAECKHYRDIANGAKALETEDFIRYADIKELTHL